MSKLKLIFSILICSFSLIISAQTIQKKTKTDSSKIVVIFQQNDTSNWVTNFRELRQTIYQNDKEKAKVFFDFPIKNEGNDIWYLAYSDNEKEIENLNGDVKDFTEKDFDKYFYHIFPSQFIKCFLKIKTDELFKNGTSVSPEIKDSVTTYRLYAEFDKIPNTIQLHFASETKFKISDSEYEKFESSTIYLFQILQNGHIKFKRIQIAG